jgi:glycosyltransferase involved in cell wall biosynthesis
LERDKGCREAIWTADMLSYVLDDVHLTLVGDGPERDWLEQFARSIRNPRIHFLGERDDAAQQLAEADVCWSPGRAGAGRQAILEAMAAGRPVIAAARLGVDELIVEGQTGWLVSPGDTVALGRRTRTLLLDPAVAAAVGAAARRYVQRYHDAARIARLWAEHYGARVRVAA